MIQKSDGEGWGVSKAVNMNLGRDEGPVSNKGASFSRGRCAYGVVLWNLGFQNSLNIFVGFSGVYSEGFLEANCQTELADQDLLLYRRR